MLEGIIEHSNLCRAGADDFSRGIPTAYINHFNIIWQNLQKKVPEFVVENSNIEEVSALLTLIPERCW